MFQNQGFATRFGLGIVAGGGGACADGRKLDHPRDPVRLRQSGDAAGTYGLDPIEAVFTSFGQNTDAIDPRVGPLQGRC